jgi:cytosine/adenosine deaminase-related metal-dependent hydrolase
LSYKKFTAAQIFNGYQFLEPATVIITDKEERIIDIVPRSEAGEYIQELEGLLCPGFINAHCHLELSHMKGIVPEHTGLPAFVTNIVQQRNFPEDQIQQAIADAEQEMIANGIVAVGDICNNAHTLPQKLQNNIAYYNFIEVSGWNPSIASVRFEHSKNIAEAFQSQIDPPRRSRLSLSPHAPYSVSDELWHLLIPGFAGKTITIHNQECSAENELFEKGTGAFLNMYEQMHINNAHFVPTGKTSLQSYYPKLENAGHKILVHNTFISTGDITYINSYPETRIPKPSTVHLPSSTVYGQRSTVYFCLCPNANLYIENTLPPIDLLRKNNCNIVLGTDSLASNHQLSIWEEIKTIQKHFPHILLQELLQWATINGAHALQMDTELGSFEKGKRPGFILLHENRAPRNVF